MAISPITITLPYPHPLQRDILLTNARFKIVVCGRRWGKTTLGLIAATEMVVQGGYVWWVLPNYGMASDVWREVKETLRPVTVAKNEVERRIDVIGGGYLSVKSADNPDSLRGSGLDLVVIDEAAQIKEEAWTAALRPALSDRVGGALLISTPRGRNWFYYLYLAGQDEDNYEFQSWQHMTETSPTVTLEEIASARSQLPQRIFEQEYEATFLEGEGAVFRNVRGNLVSPSEPHQHEHKMPRFGMAVDWGKHQDYTAISVGCMVCKCEVELVRFNQIDYEYQKEKLRALYRKWQPYTILAESNAMGEPIIDSLKREGLPVQGFATTATSKPPLIENLALVYEQGEWAWLDDQVAINEAEAFERKFNPITARSTYSAPQGLHDDTVIARALLAWLAHVPKAFGMTTGRRNRSKRNNA